MATPAAEVMEQDPRWLCQLAFVFTLPKTNGGLVSRMFFSVSICKKCIITCLPAKKIQCTVYTVRRHTHTQHTHTTHKVRHFSLFISKNVDVTRLMTITIGSYLNIINPWHGRNFCFS
jgi:hypothetical protein